jgi:hypothetical protein
MHVPPSAAAPARRPRLPSPLAWALFAAFLAVAGSAYWVLDAASRRAPELTPRHRAEALCFALAAPPPFEPPMAVQASAAFVRGRFTTRTPASFALRQMMRFTDDMVLREWSARAGDYDIDLLWLRFPGKESEHWLVAAWMEGADLAVCNFRFAGTSRVLSEEERLWGTRVVQRLIVDEHFRRGEIPDVRWRAVGGASLPTFGPSAATATAGRGPRRS